MPLNYWSTVIGIDPSLTCTGITTLMGDAQLYAKVARVQSKGSSADNYAARFARLEELRSRIVAEVGEHTGTGMSRLIVIEGPSLGGMKASSGAMHDRSGLWWFIWSGLADHRTDFLVVPPTVRAKYATGRGNAGKDEVMAATIRRYPHVEIIDNNTADSTVLAAIGARMNPVMMNLELGEGGLPKANLDALRTLKVAQW